MPNKRLAEGTHVEEEDRVGRAMNMALARGEEFGCSTVHVTCERPSGSTPPVPPKAAELDPSLAAQKKKAQNITERREEKKLCV